MRLVNYEIRNGVGLLTLNRPEALNALNGALLSELSDQLDSCAASDIRCLIVAGAGTKAFAAGADISEMKDLSPGQAEAFSRNGNEIMKKLEDFPVPVVAAVNGFALGGGCELALSCDIRIASEKAVFALPEVSLGVIPGYGGIQRLSRLIGPGKAKLLIFSTERISAERALEWGLVEAVYPHEKLMEEAFSLAAKIVRNAPIAVKNAKQIANRCGGLNIQTADSLESVLFGECFATQDQKEGMAAFVEKRQVSAFTGR